MAQVAIYLDDETIDRLDAASKRDGMSRSAWVRMAVQARLTGQLPESFFNVLGTWEDDGDADAILRELRENAEQNDRPSIDT